MGFKIDISAFKCFNQLRNGEDFDQNLTEFTPNLVGNVGEKVRIQFLANFSIDANAEGAEVWDMTTGRIERTSGNFKEDGILVGNRMRFFSNWDARFTDSVEFQATIDTISSDGTILTFTLLFGAQITVGEAQNVGFSIQQAITIPENLYTASLLRFGLINNEEPFNFISKTSKGQQVYYAIELAFDDLIDYISLGKLKDWVTGNATIKELLPFDSFTQQYEIIHDFVINPWFILEFKTNLLNDTVPEFLTGNNSLKYSFDLEFRQTLTDIASAKNSITEDIDGVVGWFGENFNGFNNNYELVSIAYEDNDTTDPLDGIGINNNTKVTVVVGRKTGSITSDHSASVHVSLLPVSESQYQQTETNLIQNFLFDSLTLAFPDTSNTGTGIIKSVDSSLNAGLLTLVYVITYDTADKLRLTEELEYMTWIQIEDDTLATGNSDRVAILADLRNYTDANFVADFLNFTEYDFFTHELTRGSDIPKTTITDAINEDGIALATRFSSDASKNVVINTLRHVLIARNLTTGIFFILDDYAVDIGNTITDGNGVQQFTVQVGRGYDLRLDDQFNLVELFTRNKVGNDQFYEGYFGQKIKWQDWLSNALVDTVFFDSAEPNDNLNFKSSNYSEKNSYEIFLATIVNVSGDDDLGRNVTGDFIQLGGKIIVDDYDDNPNITGVIETLDPDTLQSLGGAVLYNGKDTIFKVTYTRVASEFVDYAIQRLEPSLSLGNGIQELSSKLPFPDDNIIIPLEGETLLKVTDNGLTVITEGRISGSKVQEGIDYKLSSRIGTNLLPPPTFIYSVTVAASETISLPMFDLDDSLYDFTVNFGDGTGNKNVTAYADADRQHTYAGAGTFDITITGTFDYIRFLDSPNSIVELKEFGPASIGEKSFLDCINFTTISAIDIPGIHLTTLTECFRNAALTTVDATIDTWDVSTVTDMSLMFRDSSFNTDITSWDTGAVTDMSNMFRSSPFNQAIGTWDVSGVTTMAGMFLSATTFNQDLSAWVTTALLNLNATFQSASVFNNGGAAFTINVSSVTNMNATFQSCVAFNADISSWVVSAVTDMSSMLFGTSIFNQDISSWNVSAVTNMTSMFQNSLVFNQDITSWVVSAVTNMTSMFQNANAFNQAIGVWNVAAVTTMQNMFFGADVFNQNIAAWNTGVVTNMNNMFNLAIAFNQNIAAWNTGAVTDMSSMFFSATLFNQNIGAWNITSLTNAASMFTNITLSVANYDGLLTGWEAQVELTNVSFSGGNSLFTKAPSAAATARGVLIATSTWTIVDGGPTP